MKNQKEVQVIGILDVQRRIIPVRGIQVMLDRDLAALYGVETRVLNQAVQRNIGRFPEDFMFQLTKEDCLRSQIVTLNEGRGKHLKYLPYAFTENGIAMLSSVLRSETAIDVNIRIMRAFTAMRRFAYDHAGLVQRVGSRLIESAQSEIVLIDPYSDAVTLEVLSKKRPGVKVRLVCKDRGKPTQTEIAKFNRQYKGLAVTYSDDFHDRFLIIDNTELHGLGSSINCLGRRVTSYTTRDAREIAKLLAMVP